MKTKKKKIIAVRRYDQPNKIKFITI